MADRVMSFDFMVRAILLISSLVESGSAMTMRVPSDRTTFSKGAIKKANGSL